MFTTLDIPSSRLVLHNIRFLQLLAIYAFGLGAYLFTKFPHNIWILFAVLAISGFDTGLQGTRALKRIKGSIAGLILVLPLFYFCQLNYRLIPLGFILSACFMWLPNSKNYHVTIVFFIFLLFFLTAYSFTAPTLEGPTEFVVNRLVCEVTAILICLGADYVVFSKFNYSRKVYFLLQFEACKMFEEKCEKIVLSHKLNKEMDNLFIDIENSKESLLKDLRTDQETKERLIQFANILPRLRNEIYSIYYRVHILKESQPEIQIHILEFKKILEQAKNNFISVR